MADPSREEKEQKKEVLENGTRLNSDQVSLLIRSQNIIDGTQIMIDGIQSAVFTLAATDNTNINFTTVRSAIRGDDGYYGISGAIRDLGENRAVRIFFPTNVGRNHWVLSEISIRRVESETFEFFVLNHDSSSTGSRFIKELTEAVEQSLRYVIGDGATLSNVHRYYNTSKELQKKKKDEKKKEGEIAKKVPHINDFFQTALTNTSHVKLQSDNWTCGFHVANFLRQRLANNMFSAIKPPTATTTIPLLTTLSPATTTTQTAPSTSASSTTTTMSMPERIIDSLSPEDRVIFKQHYQLANILPPPPIISELLKTISVSSTAPKIEETQTDSAFAKNTLIHIPQGCYGA
ncbi:MAG: hypothetical protein LBP39_03225 [Rickettsiales bacterium]|jgi:hypothetical protein|nr:hypothetical protein [Rickettsiales bacterium]